MLHCNFRACASSSPTSALFCTAPAGLYQFITNFSNTVDNVSGPVAILAAGAEVARANTGGLYQFAALININLAVVNILPLPALDGEPDLLLRLGAVCWRLA
jgi:membrane-associated protease RseP (regulator of RpoE activity)